MSFIKTLNARGYKVVLILGYGRTGKAVHHFLLTHYPKKHFTILIHQSGEKLPSLKIYGDDVLVIVSPGVDMRQAQYVNLYVHHHVISEIELFAWHVSAFGGEVLAITGTNGKSTMCAMLAHALKKMRYQVALGGNFGEPAIGLLQDGLGYDYYVIELSSFQLLDTVHLKPRLGVLLNVTPDHLDRHDSFESYAATKQKLLIMSLEALDFSSVSNQSMTHVQQLAQILKSLQLPSVQGVNDETIQKLYLTDFSGLPFRYELILEKDGKRFINDSKATNVGSMQSAVNTSIQMNRNIILLLGGISKGVSFEGVFEKEGYVSSHLKCVIFYGQDAALILETLSLTCVSFVVKTLEEAFLIGLKFLSDGDDLLFSPACSSYDQYDNFMERGRDFNNLVNRYVCHLENLESI